MHPRHTFIAVLRRDGLTVEELVLPRRTDTAPMTLRFPTDFHGTAAWDVYGLSSLEQWPVAAHYDHQAITPRTTITL
jgi:hypothetical protein